MTFSDDRDPTVESLLRSALTDEAESVSPRGDGLTRIQQRVATRRARRVWLRPLAAVGAVAVVGAAAIGTYAATHRPGNSDDSLVTSHSPTPSASTSTPPSPSPSASSPATMLPAFPPAAFFPFDSAAAEQAWEASSPTGSTTSYGDAVTVATSFVRDFVGEPSVSLVLAKHVGTSLANVTLGRTMSDGASSRTWPVTVVRLVKYASAWEVVGADDANSMLKVSSPAAGAAVTAPVTASGPAYGVDEAIRIDVRGLSGSLMTAPAQASFGDASPPWSAQLSYDPKSAQRGAVVATEASAADGGVARIAAVGVSFATATDVGYPSYFYGVKSGRVTKFSARDGAALNYLTTGKPAASDPQRVQGLVYFIASDGACASSLRSVSASGDAAAAATVATADPGYVISGYGVSPDGTRVALSETACKQDSSKPQGQLVGIVLASHTRHALAFPSFPPMVEGDPVWEQDATHVDAVVRTGNMAGVQRYDVFAAKDWQDSTNGCGGSDFAALGMPTTLSTSADGSVWVAAEQSGGITVLRCTSGGPVKAFDVPSAAAGPQDLTVTDDGRAALVTDGEGAVWRWSGAAVAKVTPRVAQPQVTW